MTTTTTTRQHAGADWLRQCRVTAISPLGETVADLLADLLAGLHHLEDATRVDWADTHHIEVRLAWKELASFDSNLLTRLVFLAHDRCVRVSVQPRSHHALTLMFHPRKRTGGVWDRHPTLEDAVTDHRRYYPADMEAQEQPL